MTLPSPLETESAPALPDRRPALVPAEVNVASFPWAPVRLEFFAAHPLALHPSGEPFRALVLLIAQAWRQQPAMTLPNDEARLAAMAGFGRDIAGWLQVREPVLSGWFLGDDDRFHHEELAPWALQAWASKQSSDRFAEQQRQRALAGARSRGAARAQPKREDEIEIQVQDKDQIDKETIGSTEDSRRASSALVNVSLVSDQGASERDGKVGEEKAVELIFEHWKRKTGRPKEVLTPPRRRIVQARLAEGLASEVLCRAIDAASVDDFYLGRTSKQSRRIDTLDVILKDQDRVLRLASASDSAPNPIISQAAAATARTFMHMFGASEPVTIDSADIIDTPPGGQQ